MSLTGMRTELIRRSTSLTFTEAPGDHPDWQVLTIEVKSKKHPTIFTDTKPFKVQGHIRPEDSKEAAEYALIRWALSVVPDPNVKDPEPEVAVVTGEGEAEA